MPSRDLVFRLAENIRPTLTVELYRDGDTLRRRYFLPASNALEHIEVVDSYCAIGAEYSFGDWHGIDALREVLVHGEPDVLRANLTGDRLDLVGRLLFEVLFGSRSIAATEREVQHVLRAAFAVIDERRPSPTDKPLRVRILAHDHALAALPWQATMWRDKLLTASDWTFEIVSALELGHRFELRAPARVLIVAPELPEGGERDDERFSRVTRRHVERLQQIFSAVAPPGDVRIVRREKELRESIKEFHPTIVYLYGHGDASDGQNRIVLRDKERVLVRNLGEWLRNAKPILVFLNACSSGQAGWHSAWWQLGHIAPVIISNTMVALDDHAARYAEQVFARFLDEGMDPVQAANISPAHSEHAFDWATAVTHTSYGELAVIRGPRPRTGVAQAELWVDRDTQRAIAFKHVTDLCADKQQRVEAIMSYGEPGNRVEAIPRQCIDYIQSKAQSIALRYCPVKMPLERGEQLTRTVLEQRLKLDFQHDMAADLTSILRAKAPKPLGDRDRVLWLDWGVLKKERKYKDVLETWLKFIRDIVAQKCPSEIRVVASIQVEADKDVVGKLADAMPRYRGKREFRTPAFWCTALAPLDKVSDVDIVTFLRRHDCPENFVEDVARAIFKKTRGEYEQTAQWLRNGMEQGWPVVLDELFVPESEDDDF